MVELKLKENLISINPLKIKALRYLSVIGQYNLLISALLVVGIGNFRPVSVYLRKKEVKKDTISSKRFLALFTFSPAIPAENDRKCLKISDSKLKSLRRKLKRN